MNKLVAVLVVSCVGVFASAGCAVDSGDEKAPAATQAQQPTAAEEENIGKTEAALSSGGGGGGGGNSFSCGPIGCICNGDWDCNNLFGSGACGSWPAKCYTRGPAQYCICAPWVGAQSATGGGAGGAVTGVATSGVLAKCACAGPSRSHKTAHRDHRFRLMPITQNGASRSPDR